MHLRCLRSHCATDTSVALRSSAVCQTFSFVVLTLVIEDLHNHIDSLVYAIQRPLFMYEWSVAV